MVFENCKSNMKEYESYLTTQGFKIHKSFGWYKDNKIIKLNCRLDNVDIIIMDTEHGKVEVVYMHHNINFTLFKEIISNINTDKYIQKEESIQNKTNITEKKVKYHLVKFKDKIKKKKKKKRKKYIPKDAMYHRYPGSFESGR